MTGPVTVSVVICAYTMDRWSQVTSSVRSVLRQSPEPLEVLLVVDHCPELESKARAELAPLGVTVLANTRPRGLSGARNIGCRVARGDVVAFLDDDAEADPGWLAAHAAQYLDDEVLGVGGLVTPRWETAPPAWFPLEFGWVVGCSYVGQPSGPADVRNPIGANMSFRRRAIEAAGGFAESLGRIGASATGCEETELSIRVARLFPGGRIVQEPSAVVHHHVPSTRGRWSYFRRRCWSEGRSKAWVSRLADPRDALSSERSYVLRALPSGVARDLRAAVSGREIGHLARAAAICAGLSITTAGFVAGRVDFNRRQQQKDGQMNEKRTEDQTWLHFDVHGRVGVRVAASAPAAAQLRTMLACFASAGAVPADVEVSRELEPVDPVSDLENELRYSPESVELVEEGVQVVRRERSYRIHGDGELLTALVPILDRAMVERGAAMIHAATVGYRGYGIALPAAGGTGKTSTVAKLMRKPGFSFMGDDWAFLSDDKRLLGYEKPMFIKPHHRPIYPHLFQGVRKPMVPVALSRPVGRLTTVVHPMIIQYPKLADVARRWSPEHRMVDASQALPGVPVTAAAPLLVSAYVERYSGSETRLVDVSTDWMVDRMIGNFQVEMASFSQRVVTAMAAASMLSWRELVGDKSDVLTKSLDGVPCYLVQVPRDLSPDAASDAVVGVLEELLPALLGEQGARG